MLVAVNMHPFGNIFWSNSVQVHRPTLFMLRPCFGQTLIPSLAPSWMNPTALVGQQRTGRGTPMSVTTMPGSGEANDILTARADERLSHAYEQIARADEQLARLTEQLTRMEQDAAHQPSVISRRKQGRPALRGLVGLLAAACIAGAAFGYATLGASAAAAPSIIIRAMAP